MNISVVITAYNEGDELKKTIDSVLTNTLNLHEIILVDDGSTDGSCVNVQCPKVIQVTHPARIGVAYSRNEGASIATGDVLSFLDGHQRLSPHCLDLCGKLAIKKFAIVSPGIQGFEQHNRLIHSAHFCLCPKKGFFSAGWNLKPSWRKVQTSNALRGPGYSIPKELYRELCWINGMTGWGGSEALLNLKAFFTRTPILYLRGPIAYHKFKKQFHYEVNWEDVWLNQAMIARVCFDNDSWKRYWQPEVFSSHLTGTAEELIDSEETSAQQQMFHRFKRRNDSDFWKSLLRSNSPTQLRSRALTPMMSK